MGTTPSGPPLGSLPAAVWSVDQELRLTFANDRARTFFGVTEASELLGHEIATLLHARERANPTVLHHVAALAGERRVFRCEHLDRRFALAIEPLRSDEGAIEGCVASAIEVTELPDTEVRLANVAWLQEAQRIARVGSWEWDIEREVFVWAPEMYAMLQIDSDATRAATSGLGAYVHFADVEPVRAILQRAIANGETVTFEHRVERPNGDVRILHSRTQLLRASGAPRRVVGTSWDITDLWDAKSWPERSASLLRATLEATADGILVVDHSGAIVTFNQRFIEMWKIPESLAARTDNAGLLAFVVDQLIDPSSFMSMVKESQTDPAGEYYYVMHFRDGRVFERCARPQRVGTEILGRVLSFRDITEREHLLGRAERAVRQRDEFLSIAAHEIRGPISAIRLAVQHLQTLSPSSPAMPKVLDILDREQRRLVSFVDELLDVGRIRTVGLHFELAEVDLAAVAREVVTRISTEASRAGSTIELEGDESVVGMWDRVRIDQVVTNLLSNAIKFGDKKPILVRVLGGEDNAVLEVRDHGHGVAPDMLERLFLPFERGVSVKNYGGLGLGLYIVQTIVGTFRGTVQVTNQPEGGALFQVELPRRAATA